MVAFSKGSSVLASISFMTSGICKISRVLKRIYTDKKENEIFLIYKEIQMGAVAKSYMYEVGLPTI
jgi:hypothetical protein